MKIMKNLTAAALAVAAFAAPFAARSATNGDIFEIRPVDKTGAAASDGLDEEGVARFAVRLAKPLQTGNPFRLYPVGIYAGYPDLAMALDPPGIGIFVNGVFTLAYLESVKQRNETFTDLIFTYTAKPGDFAKPVRLADSARKLVTDTDNPPDAYYLTFLDDSLGYPSWKLDDSVHNGAAATKNVDFCLGTPTYHPAAPESDGRRWDPDLSGCKFNIQTVFFDSKDEDPSYWRSVHEHSTEAQPVGDIPSLVVTGVPTNSVTLYVWSENPAAVVVAPGRDVVALTERDVHVTAADTEKRMVGEIRIVPGKQEYEFNLRGVGQGNNADIVMSAFPDFNYYDGYPTKRLQDYDTRVVKCIGPMPASVTIKPGKTTVTATSDYAMYVTELNVSLSENPVDHAFDATIVPSLPDGCPRNWWDYIRLTHSVDVDPTLNVPSGNPVLSFKVGETKPASLNGQTLTDGKIYLYALRSDEWVTGANKLSFAVRTDDATASKPSAEGGIDGWDTDLNPNRQSTLTVNAQNPVVESMFDGTDAASAVANVARTLQIVVSDVYADMTCTDDGLGYEIWIEKNTDTDTTFTQLPGLYRPGKGNVLFKAGTTDELPSVTYTDTGDISSTLYVVSPITRNQSANHNFKVTVTAPAGFTVTTTDDVYEYNEGDPLQLKITLDRQNTLGDMWAYIRGETAADTDAIDCSWKAQAGGHGRKFSNFSTVLTSGCTIRMIDGDASTLGSTYSYEIVFLNQDTWTDDPGARVTAFQSKNTLVLTTHNVVPTVESVSIADGLYEVGADGGSVKAKFPVNVAQTFSVVVDEPGDLDKNPTDPEMRKFQVRWFFQDEDDNKSGPITPAGHETDGIVEGDPDLTSCTFDFPSAGRWTVTVELRDKDMGNKWGNGEVGRKFTFYIDAIDSPAITVRHDSPYNEQDCIDFGGEAAIDVELDINNCNFDMWVNLKVEPNTTGGTGTFLLLESDDVVLQGDGSYNVRFPKKTTSRTVFVKTMDGTVDSRTTGFKITPTMVEDTAHVVPNSGGKHPHEYYTGVAAGPVKVLNNEPLLDEEFDVYPVPSTNAIPAAIGAADETITWAFDDVELDFTRGITVEIKGGGGWGPKTYHDKATALADGQIGFTPSFTRSGPGQSVKLTIKDSDGGVRSVIWYYDIEAAKSMTLVAHGPASGDVSRYDSAAGLGKGRVWAESRSVISAKSFSSSVNCGLASEWRIYGYGYKVGDLDDGATFHMPDGFGGYTLAYYADRDTPLNTAGANLGGGTPYAYAAPRDGNGNPVDSFLYTWMLKANEKDGGTSTFSFLNEMTAPEYILAHDSGKSVTLPSEADDKGTYAEATAEAIFSIEYLASDNMGDINLDGVPDAYVNKYGFGLVNVETGVISGNDLKGFDGYNDDEDYLPAGETSVYGSLIPGLAGTWATVGRKFTAFDEIRGNGPALNDAPENNSKSRIANTRPDRVYTDPRVDKLSTLDGFDGGMAVEYLAWLEFAAANGLDPADSANWSLWSPERPTDPMVDDTDEDGFPDGYEYYIWYRAHVGYNDGGVHKYQTGRAYDPRNPGEGRFIPCEEIAAAYDPVVKNGLFSDSLDTDNDGLPDLIEFTIGTNPFDFDTDGDGLPDGFEIMVAGTNPLLSYTTPGVSDAMRNYDGDAMAITTPEFETTLLLPPAKHVTGLVKFAYVDPDGDTDGIQWYVKPAAEMTQEPVYTDEGEGYVVRVGTTMYVTAVKPAFVERGGKFILAATLPPDQTWATVVRGEGEERKYVRLMPTRLLAGTELAAAPDVETTKPFGYLSFSEDIEEVLTAWPYGRADVSLMTDGDAMANQGGFGFLALGRYALAQKDKPLAALPSEDKTIAYLHYMVYQEFGFDPRTAWNANTPLGLRWGSATTDFEGEEISVANKFKFGFTGVPARTRSYTLYDEFLVLSFFLNGGSQLEVTPSKANPWYRIWSRYTTNGRGPNEYSEDSASGDVDLAEGGEYYEGRPAINNSPAENGADTDGDGVPDGWELYVMSGPKEYDARRDKYYFRFPGPYGDGYLSKFGPFEPEAANVSFTDNTAGGGNDTTGGDGDGLTELQEFAGTDTALYYADYSSTIRRPEEQANWLNKFFPTDPWNKDTDGDGISDKKEGSKNGKKPGGNTGFIYGSPADDQNLVTIPGGGLNPLSVDTDFDGLPDGWEMQFNGGKIYDADDATYVTVDGQPAGNPLEGLVDGMDGTVPDAYTKVNGGVEVNGSIVTWTAKRADGSRLFGKINRDYDHDGLENWQEYMAGTMRSWRYDDILTPWNGMPDDLYWKTNRVGGLDFSPDFEGINAMFGANTISTDADDGGEGEFWYRTLVDKTSPIYNPRLVSGQTTSAMYFSQVKNPWDVAYLSDEAGGAWYVFKDRIGEDSLTDLWAKPFLEETGKNGSFVVSPRKYISCSPIDHDTDRDGMDDYYELFHGMNPLLGLSGKQIKTDGPCDVVSDAWNNDGEDSTPLFEAWNSSDPAPNVWVFRAARGINYKTGKPPRGTGYDFEYFPWLNGLAAADPDGDDVRNQHEAIMPKMATQAWMHTDPTPLWMTDASYSNSLVRLFFRMPGRREIVPTPGLSFTYNGVTYDFIDFGGWVPPVPMVLPPRFVAFSQDNNWWGMAGGSTMDWMYSFEENEGYDSDHDAMSDFDEHSGRMRAASDPQDANSPNRRQAMYFPGPAKPSALQTPPEVKEVYPVSHDDYPDEMSFKQFTVECWAKAESLADATIVERVTWCDESKAGDEEFVRKNFLLGIKNGKWYARYDSDGTLVRNSVEILSANNADTEAWHHLAATYDGTRCILFVDGEEAATPVETSVPPENGTSAIVVRRMPSVGNLATIGMFNIGDYWRSIWCELKTIVVGASLKSTAEGGDARAFDVYNGMGWGYYTRFFTGFVDEVRIWDGARTAAEIRADVRALRRYGREDALENRTAFYKDWTQKGNRYMKDENGDAYSVVPELRYHFAFDSVPGGADEGVVAKAPAGFDYYKPAALGNPERGAAVLSRPETWNVAWWAKVLEGYGSVYSSDQWVQWVPNTVAHLPRFDGTTLDSFFWSENTCGGTNGTYRFERNAEPYSQWVQAAFVPATLTSDYRAPGARHHLVCTLDNLQATGGTNELFGTKTRLMEFRFTGRNLLQDGCDLLPLGGAFAKSCPEMWDGQHASTAWEVVADDGDYNGLPDAWEEFAVANYSPESEPLDWDTTVYWKADVRSDAPGIAMSAGEAYRRDLAHGRVVVTDPDGYPDIADRGDLAQRADEDYSRTPDWWDDLYGVYGAGGTTDSDNDGLSNYTEYLVSEVFPFGMALNPKMPKTDAKTLDYFRKVGSLYLGEMFTDHDQMEDHWERGLDSDTVDPNVWDAQRDGDEDGWSNFAENRYNGWCQSTLAQFISHTSGDTTVKDMPKPTIKLTVRYNGVRDLSKGEGDGKTGGAPTLRVLTYTDHAMTRPDAEFAVQPGVQDVAREFFLGGWENRVIRGTLDPGYINYGSVDLKFAQVPQSDLYSWIDENGNLHLSRPYSEFKEALAKNPNIIQNVQDFKWDSLIPAAYNGATQQRATTVTEDGYIAVYGERVGKIDLVTGDFEFDMGAMASLSFKGFYEGNSANSWGIKEGIYKLVYTAEVPDVELYKVAVSLAEPAKGFVKGGMNSIFAYWDVGSDGSYTPGTDPCGVLRDVEIGWRERSLELELTDMSAITPRLKLWSEGGQGQGGGSSGGSGGGESGVGDMASASDRGVRLGLAQPTNTTTATLPTAPDVRVRVVRLSADQWQMADLGLGYRVIFDKVFSQSVRDFIHEGDFLGDGEFDIDWSTLGEVVDVLQTSQPDTPVTNVAYAVVFGEAEIDRDTNHPTNAITAHPVLVTRRFEVARTAPTAPAANGVSDCRVAQPTFSWKIENEDKWASAFGTTYTAFKVKVWNADGQEVYDSGVRRMPAADSYGVYSWTAPLYVDAPSPSGAHLVFKNLELYTWRVFTYNAKFKTDDVGSETRTFRMNVTDVDQSSYSIDAKVCYAGPARNRQNRFRVQAFESPDFTGDPVAEAVVTNINKSALAAANGSPVRLSGLRPGRYFLRAYIDTDYDWQLDDWESWGYLSERDHAAVSGTKEIFNPAYVTVGPEIAVESPRKVFIEDRDTDGDCFPDVWEAEGNGYVFDPWKFAPVSGDAELIAVNTNLTSTLTKASQGFNVSGLMTALRSPAGVALLTGVPPSGVKTTSSGALLLPESVVEGSVAITSLAVDGETGEVVLGVAAETEADGVDQAVSALYTVASGSTVKVKVYRTETLAGEWKLVAEETVQVTSGAAEVRAKLPDGLDAKSGFFKVEVE